MINLYFENRLFYICLFSDDDTPTFRLCLISSGVSLMREGEKRLCS